MALAALRFSANGSRKLTAPRKRSICVGLLQLISATGTEGELHAFRGLSRILAHLRRQDANG